MRPAGTSCARCAGRTDASILAPRLATWGLTHSLTSCCGPLSSSCSLYGPHYMDRSIGRPAQPCECSPVYPASQAGKIGGMQGQPLSSISPLPTQTHRRGVLSTERCWPVRWPAEGTCAPEIAAHGAQNSGVQGATAAVWHHTASTNSKALYSAEGRSLCGQEGRVL